MQGDWGINSPSKNRVFARVCAARSSILEKTWFLTVRADGTVKLKKVDRKS
ncbi:MAG: hypothetical protein HC894_04705 [Microcoleus sp. SM1_3_4]|nr:hypothetical protein [Microcoleus sp. SM1_3_4]